MNISAEYFIRLLFPNIWEMYYAGEYFLRLFLPNISAMYYNKIPEWSDSRKEKPLSKSTVHPNGFAYRCQCFEERLGLNS